MATPFVQGHLRDDGAALEIETRCAHCDEPLHISVDADLNCRVREPDARPLVFEPAVDWEQFTEPNIVHGY
jgi:hypothetical protein